MPVVLRFKGFRFFFYSNEGDPREPVHVHVRSAVGEAKFWVQPEATLAWSEGLNATNLRELQRVVQDNVHLIEEAWHDHFG